MIILAPGPNSNGLPYCVHSKPIVWFGVSVNARDMQETYQKLKQCLSYIAVRELASFDISREYVRKNPPVKPVYKPESVGLSADISFSFKVVDFAFT